MKLHANGAHSSAQQLKQVLVGLDGDNMHLPTCADEVSEQSEIRRAFDKARNAPMAGNSTASVFNGKLQADLPFLDSSITVRAMDVFSKYPPLIPVRAKHPRGVWGAFFTSRIGVFGPLRCIQMDDGGEWKNKAWTELRSYQRIKLSPRCAHMNSLAPQRPRAWKL